MLQSKMCLFAKQLFAMFAKQRCDFHHNSMRSRQIFEIIDYLNNAHFVLQNESSYVCFIYWMQMLLRCEIDRNAKRVRNHCEDFVILSDLILILKAFNKVFFKKTFEHICSIIYKHSIIEIWLHSKFIWNHRYIFKCLETYLNSLLIKTFVWHFFRIMINFETFKWHA